VHRLLSGLRDRLQEQSRVPDLPPDWRCVSAMLPAHGFEYGGDFFVADLVDTGSGPGMQMILVDVCGSGPTAVPDAMQFAGALGGLVAAVPPEKVLAGANGYLLRLPSDEAIATAAHVIIEFGTGGYRIRSAGHPPVLRWDAEGGEWLVDAARGTALGVVEDPEFSVSEGVLAPGEALLFYTDGVVESRSTDIETGIEWLRAAAREAYRDCPGTAPQSILAQVARGDDDRAVLIIARRP
jgi:serine phosphatase RsbU (regulator of sigma subunit)